jgi:hypothetical protein
MKIIDRKAAISRAVKLCVDDSVIKAIQVVRPTTMTLAQVIKKLGAENDADLTLGLGLYELSLYVSDNDARVTLEAQAILAMTDADVETLKAQPTWHPQLANDLRAVDALLSDENRWTQGELARNSDGSPTEPWKDDAVCWDIIGAVQHVVQREAIARENAIFQALYLNGNLERFNDNNDFQTVKALIREAIELNS